jgi:hypothetical protein
LSMAILITELSVFCIFSIPPIQFLARFSQLVLRPRRRKGGFYPHYGWKRENPPCIERFFVYAFAAFGAGLL